MCCCFGTPTVLCYHSGLIGPTQCRGWCWHNTVFALVTVGPEESEVSWSIYWTKLCDIHHCGYKMSSIEAPVLQVFCTYWWLCPWFVNRSIQLVRHRSDWECGHRLSLSDLLITVATVGIFKEPVLIRKRAYTVSQTDVSCLAATSCDCSHFYGTK